MTESSVMDEIRRQFPTVRVSRGKPPGGPHTRHVHRYRIWSNFRTRTNFVIRFIESNVEWHESKHGRVHDIYIETLVTTNDRSECDIWLDSTPETLS